mgnify:CR=1 FL=1
MTVMSRLIDLAWHILSKLEVPSWIIELLNLQGHYLWIIGIVQKKRKKLLRDILKKYIPEQIFDVPKKGFSVPIKEWSRNQLKNEIKKKLNKKNLKKISGIDIKKFQELMEEHFDGSLDFSLSIWRVYVLILWFDKHTNSSI